MRRHLGPVLVALASAAVVGLLAFGLLKDSGASGGAVGSTPPETALATLDGATKRSLVAYRGRPLVVNIFASWCRPCREEAPVLRRVAATGTPVLGVTYADNSSDAQAFVDHFRLDYTILRGGDDTFADALGVRGVPETFVVSRTGKIVAVRRGTVDARFLRKALAKA